jgi:DNA invertase Pin-like site-specific DNA recombinase
MQIGCARASTLAQDNKIQIAVLKKAGCKKIFQENESGGRWDRPQLHRLLEQLREDDTVVVWKLDRLSRSLKNLLAVLDAIEGANANFRSLTESINTKTPAGRMMMQMVGSFAEFERAMLKERTRAGLDQARKTGRIGGRRTKLNVEQQTQIIKLVESGEQSGADATRLFKVHPSTVTRLMARHRSEQLSAKP